MYSCRTQTKQGVSPENRITLGVAANIDPTHLGFSSHLEYIWIGYTHVFTLLCYSILLCVMYSKNEDDEVYVSGSAMEVEV